MMRTDEPFPTLAESQGDQVATMRCGDSEGQRPPRRTGRPTSGTSALAATDGGMDDLFSDASPCHTRRGWEARSGRRGAVAAVNKSAGGSALSEPTPPQRANATVRARGARGGRTTRRVTGHGLESTHTLRRDRQ
jgi:hypothetical protein